MSNNDILLIREQKGHSLMQTELGYAVYRSLKNDPSVPFSRVCICFTHDKDTAIRYFNASIKYYEEVFR